MIAPISVTAPVLAEHALRAAKLIAAAISANVVLVGVLELIIPRKALFLGVPSSLSACINNIISTMKMLIQQQ